LKHYRFDSSQNLGQNHTATCFEFVVAFALGELPNLPARMPKIALPPVPLSGLFGIYKPSGPTSMSVIDDVKQLVINSRLFVEGDKLSKTKSTVLPKRRRMREAVKIGQGGTLDPLADGVLGENDQSNTALVAHIYISTPSIAFSCRCWKGDEKAERIFGLYQGIRQMDCARHLSYNLLDRNIIPPVYWAVRRIHMTVRVLESVSRLGDMLRETRLNLSCLSFQARFTKRLQCSSSRIRC
jgi:hypothetical protein